MKTLHELGAEGRADVAERLRVELAGQPDVAFAYLFGSFVDSEAFRDVDVGVFLNAAAGPDVVGGLAERLSSRVGLPVDVRPLNSAPVPFMYHVLRGQLLLNRDDALLAEVIERTVRRYLDIAPLLRHSAKEAFAA